MKVTFFMGSLLVAASAVAQTVDAPSIRAGDRWIYQRTQKTPNEGTNQAQFELEVSRVTPSRIYFSAQKVGLRQAPEEFIGGRDLSMSRDVNGFETVVYKPLNFPLSAGKTWDLAYVELNPRSKGADKLSRLAIELTHRVVGMETIQVPAGKFKAWKIEAEGTWTGTRPAREISLQETQKDAANSHSIATTQKSGETTEVGRIYEASWYVPEIRNTVKVIKEQYDPKGGRLRSDIKELVSFTEGALPTAK